MNFFLYLWFQKAEIWYTFFYFILFFYFSGCQLIPHLKLSYKMLILNKKGEGDFREKKKVLSDLSIYYLQNT